MKESNPNAIHLRDYNAPLYKTTDVDLTFELHPTETQVESRLTIKLDGEKHAYLKLNGEELLLKSVELNGKKLQAGDYQVDHEYLTLNLAKLLTNKDKVFKLTIKNQINPEANTSLDGLYKVGSMFCTQNEPEGFRRITYFQDRPDIMAKYSTKIIADKKQYPILLSNGNPVGKGELPNGKHWATWQDPFNKPCYLYALVAGDLGMIRDTFKTKSGKKIDLRIYCDKGNESKCHHAMDSLKKAMKWDEVRFGLEYDLDIYMIVAVDAFNMGAMENKGLNIFNSVYVLANPQTATDDNFQGIESVIGHEYFHNWTGNRITCRDWFQLTLKEGLTVYRDQEFSSDMGPRAVERISQVASLRSLQFPEDSGPNAHPIRPDTYIEINNFYTPTVYEKGAEVIRMVETLLGVDGFRKGMDKYFELYDGQAVTTENFLHAMSVANDNYDFEQFKNWYKQAGTPNLKFQWNYNSFKNEMSLIVEQSCKSTNGQEKDKKDPFHMPLKFGWPKKGGTDQKAKLVNEDALTEEEKKDFKRGVLHLKKAKQTFVFSGVNPQSIPSLNRGFSAPVTIEAPYSFSDLSFLLANDCDEFNRYEASVQMATQTIMNLAHKKWTESDIPKDYGKAFWRVLIDEKLDPHLKAYALSLPSEAVLHLEGEAALVHEIHGARNTLAHFLVTPHWDEMKRMFLKLDKATQGKYSIKPEMVAKRALKNTLLHYLVCISPMGTELAEGQYYKATNLTDQLSALQALLWYDQEAGHKASDHFYKMWKHEGLVIQKWIAAHMAIPDPISLEWLHKIEKDHIFDKKIPNFVRSLYRAFMNNHAQFHRTDGLGYHTIAERILEIDKINPQMGAGLAKGFALFERLPHHLKGHAEKSLERILNGQLSKNTFEIVSKTVVRN